MCGRFVLLADLGRITDAFDIRRVEGNYKSGLDYFPGRDVAAVIFAEGQNSLTFFRWGLIPSWAKDPTIGDRLFNARAETLAEKPSFKNAFKKRRCLIVADGFYEWQKQGKSKMPVFLSLKSGEPFGFAGLYETSISEDMQKLSTCTLITTEPNQLVRTVHNRMPAILQKTDEFCWLSPENNNSAEMLSLLKPYPANLMKMEKGYVRAGD